MYSKTERIINLGKIPLKYRFQYKITLKKMLSDENMDEHTLIIKQIERSMKISDKVEDYNPDNWKFTIDNNYNFWLMSKEYVEEHFIDKEDK